jgi:hypothetical protein
VGNFEEAAEVALTGAQTDAECLALICSTGGMIRPPTGSVA